MLSSTSSKKTSKELGNEGEELSSNYLQELGYQIVERNYRCKLGELDIIAIDGEYLVFVEVKTRAYKKQQVSPLLSVTPTKMKKVTQLALYYMAKKKAQQKQPRFDVIGIVLGGSEGVQIEHIQNAF